MAGLPEPTYPDAPAQGSCYNCGFLCRMASSSVRPGPIQYFVVDWLDRGKGSLFKQIRIDSTPLKTAPYCYKGTIPNPFTDLYKVAQDKGEVKTQDVIEILGRVRNCPTWVSYQPGRDLNQHYEDWRTMELEQMRQQQSAALKEITDELAKIARRSEEADAKFQGTDAVFKWAFGILTFLTLLVAALPIFDRITDYEPTVHIASTPISQQPTPQATAAP